MRMIFYTKCRQKYKPIQIFCMRSVHYNSACATRPNTQPINQGICNKFSLLPQLYLKYFFSKSYKVNNKYSLKNKWKNFCCCKNSNTQEETLSHTFRSTMLFTTVTFLLSKLSLHRLKQHTLTTFWYHNTKSFLNKLSTLHTKSTHQHEFSNFTLSLYLL